MRCVPFGLQIALPSILLAGLLLVAPRATGAAGPADPLPLAPQGTPFLFAVVESLDASYLGDTPSHVGLNGGLEVRPNVALGDPVFRYERVAEEQRAVRVGRVTHVAWERVSGSLKVEFDPEPFVRIAVGDEVWVDLNPAPVPVRP